MNTAAQTTIATQNTPAWIDVRGELFGLLISTGWKTGTVSSSAGTVTIERGPFSKAPAGRGAEVVAIMRAALKAYGYRVRAYQGRQLDGTRYVRLETF